jgi:hypothetical protein
MKVLRWILPSLALAAVLSAGCIILTGQLFMNFNLTNPFVIDSTTNAFQREVVDLNTVSDYTKNKDKLKGLSDVAVVGKFTNVAGPAGGVQVWMTADVTNYTTVNEITTNATELWGTANLGAAVSTLNIGWSESAKLFKPSGKALLVQEVKGDGKFTLYVIGTAGTYNIKVDNGAILLVIDAGK